ncbi:uncharacterized protein EDB93DRAFT_1107544 [Suillus bovinus]|uniref:uncharacterized protein n=1 Tax=Suillus bovinus TaxID=48563 RepID=UPI001B86B4DB|nr:uncharacterized protein EDB93DRAFT_1107544 [Suillus bovinus]KAG2133597.1 hypothetical protein EDB93DRAFT_1107544 [Suillus bovinus]
MCKARLEALGWPKPGPNRLGPAQAWAWIQKSLSQRPKLRLWYDTLSHHIHTRKKGKFVCYGHRAIALAHEHNWDAMLEDTNQLLTCAGRLHMVFVVLGTTWWSLDINFKQFSMWAAACMGPSPGFGPAWAHGSGLKSGEPKPPPGRA